MSEARQNLWSSTCVLGCSSSISVLLCGPRFLSSGNCIVSLVACSPRHSFQSVVSLKQVPFPKSSPCRGVPLELGGALSSTRYPAAYSFVFCNTSIFLLFRSSEVGGTICFHQAQWTGFRKPTYTQFGPLK